MLASQATTHVPTTSLSTPTTAPPSLTASQFSLPSFPSDYAFGEGTSHRQSSPIPPTQTLHDLVN